MISSLTTPCTPERGYFKSKLCQLELSIFPPSWSTGTVLVMSKTMQNGPMANPKVKTGWCLCSAPFPYTTEVTFVPGNPTSTATKESALESFWEWAVTEYTKRSISFADDKLLAISAIAREVGNRKQDDYLAGFWRTTLAENLPWRRAVYSPARIATRPTTYRVPSWSWAAIESPVDLCGNPTDEEHESKRRPVMGIEDCLVKVKDPRDMYSAVCSASLKLTGKMRQFIWYYNKEELELPEGMTGMVVGTTISDALEDNWGDTEDAFVQVWGLEVFKQIEPNASIGILLIGVSDNPSPEPGVNCFSRVGRFKLYLFKTPIFHNITPCMITII